MNTQTLHKFGTNEAGLASDNLLTQNGRDRYPLADREVDPKGMHRSSGESRRLRELVQSEAYDS